MKKKRKPSGSAPRTIALSFLVLILVGTALLMLPFASADGQGAPLLDALFTGASATCVTGLVVRDTFQSWSLFGQIVILLLIQIGGLGFMTVIILFSLAFGNRLSLARRQLLLRSVGAMDFAGMRPLLRRVLVGTLFFEAGGALVLSLRFVPLFGWGKGIYFSVFHAISAFCNAGFDLMGGGGAFSSLTSFRDDPLVILTVSFLILTGGAGFVVWRDVWEHGFRFSRYSLHSRLVFLSLAVLTVVPTVLFLFSERNGLLADMPFGKALLSSFFLAVSPRTAGFNSLALDKLSGGGFLLECILMFVGGNPGSTAGGVKTTTILVLILSVAATLRRKKNVTAGKRSLEEDSLRTAASIVSLYLAAVLSSVFLLSLLEKVKLGEVFFHVISAVATVGLSVGELSGYTVLSKIVLILLMYFGRIGGLSLALAFADSREVPAAERPVEKIMIG